MYPFPFFNKYLPMVTLIFSMTPITPLSWLPNYFKSKPRYYIISSINILVCIFKR